MTQPVRRGKGKASPANGRPKGRSGDGKSWSTNRDRRPPMRQGLQARQTAVEILTLVIEHHRPLDEALARAFATAASQAGGAEDGRDRGFARAIASTVLRRHGQLDDMLSRFLEKGWPKGAGTLRPILLAAAAQLVFLDVPPHAVIHLAIEQCRLDGRARRFDKLANAVLRRISEQGAVIAEGQDAAVLNVPAWIRAGWDTAYGPETSRSIALACLAEAPLDLSVKADASGWAERLGGQHLPTGAVRLTEAGRVEEIEGFADGGWWVQDAAAQIPARLLGDVSGLSVADLCAAPGGKTAELASAGARVTAVDVSTSRIAVLAENLARLGLEAEHVTADILGWQPGRTFDAVLLDAPCSATGTIRRHPDILHRRRPEDVQRMLETQAGLLEAAIALLKPGGILIYCVCSLEPDEGPVLVERALSKHSNLTRRAIVAGEAGCEAGWLTAQGDLRTLPCHLSEIGGMDGFYAARILKQ